MNSSVKCVRDIRDIPPHIYALEKDGRQGKHLQIERQRLTEKLATFANGDGTSITVGEARLCHALGWSRGKIYLRLLDLERLGFLVNHGLTGFKETMLRTLNVAAILAKADVQSTPITDVQSSSPDVQSTPVQLCNLQAPDVQSTPPKPDYTSEDCTQPSEETEKQPTKNQPASQPTGLLQIAAQNAAIREAAGKAGRLDASVGGGSSQPKATAKPTPKARWREVIKVGDVLPESMVAALPKDNEYELLLSQIEQVGAERFFDAVTEWADNRSPRIEGRDFGRWTCWLEEGNLFFQMKVESAQWEKGREERKAKAATS